LFVARFIIILLLPAILFQADLNCRAEVFVLSSGGSVSGELVNRSEIPRKQYVIKLAGEGQITLAASQVEQVLNQRPEEDEYKNIRPAYPDAAEAQWALAEWCRQHKMPVERETHLKRIVELDPNHADARRALGFVQIDGQWTTQDQLMIERGYKRYKGRWRLQQEIDLIENNAKLDAARQEWSQNIKRWRGWLGTDREEQARANFGKIADPMAVEALMTNLHEDGLAPARMLYIEALARINTPKAAKALANAAIEDPVEELRLSCLDHLQKEKRPDIVAFFVSKLRDKKDNLTVNLAAVALGRMNDPSSIGPLIDALVTSHKFKVVKSGGDGSTSASFGSGGAGLSMGGGPKFITKQFPNQAALDALMAITGQNFGFDKSLWRKWYSAQKKPETIDARRN
jgi:hypothetical protein